MDTPASCATSLIVAGFSPLLIDRTVLPPVKKCGASRFLVPILAQPPQTGKAAADFFGLPGNKIITFRFKRQRPCATVRPIIGNLSYADLLAIFNYFIFNIWI
jgi:hypothetical protein